MFVKKNAVIVPYIKAMYQVRRPTKYSDTKILHVLNLAPICIDNLKMKYVSYEYLDNIDYHKYTIFTFHGFMRSHNKNKRILKKWNKRYRYMTFLAIKNEELKNITDYDTYTLICKGTYKPKKEDNFNAELDRRNNKDTF